MKGLPRSLKRAKGLRGAVPLKHTIPVNTTVTVSATGAAIGFGSVVLGGLPEGNILLLGAVANLGFAGSGADDNLADDWEGDYGIGTTPADDATITGADVNIIPSTGLGAATAEVVAATRGALAAALTIDNTDGSGEINLNVLIDAADITNDESVDLTVTGVLTLSYQLLGDD